MPSRRDIREWDNATVLRWLGKHKCVGFHPTRPPTHPPRARHESKAPLMYNLMIFPYALTLTHRTHTHTHARAIYSGPRSLQWMMRLITHGCGDCLRLQVDHVCSDVFSRGCHRRRLGRSSQQEIARRARDPTLRCPQRTPFRDQKPQDKTKRVWH